MSNVDWYRQRLAEVRGVAPAAPPAPSPPSNYPTVFQPPAQPAPPPSIPVGDSAQASPGFMSEIARMDGIDAAIVNWQGGEGTKQERERCPKCNGNKYFSRSQTTGVVTQHGTRARPSPRCFECGYNGLWEQYGSKAAGG